MKKNNDKEWIMKEIIKQLSCLVIDYCHINHPQTDKRQSEEEKNDRRDERLFTGDHTFFSL